MTPIAAYISVCRSLLHAESCHPVVVMVVVRLVARHSVKTSEKSKDVRSARNITPEPWALWWLLFPPHPSFPPFVVAAPWFCSYGWCCCWSPLSCGHCHHRCCRHRYSWWWCQCDVVAAAAGRRRCGLQSLRGGEQRVCVRASCWQETESGV